MFSRITESRLPRRMPCITGLLFSAALLMIGLMLGNGPRLHAQSNFAFWLGGTHVQYGNHAASWGTSVGATGKFNITEDFLLRGQFNVDRVQFQNAQLPDFSGTQTMTFICLGTGPEFAVGGKDFSLFANATIHGDIRTVLRIIQEDNKERVWALTRFSLGFVGGIGFEEYITDNLGFETQVQYDIFNFDTTPLDPSWRGLRASVGVQFYLGRNYVRGTSEKPEE